MNLSKSQKTLIEKWWVNPNSRYTVTAVWSSKEKRDGRYPVILVRMDTSTGDFDRECIIAYHLTEEGCTSKIRAIDDYVAELDNKWLQRQSQSHKDESTEPTSYYPTQGVKDAPESEVSE